MRRDERSSGEVIVNDLSRTVGRPVVGCVMSDRLRHYRIDLLAWPYDASHAVAFLTPSLDISVRHPSSSAVTGVTSR
ncbi:hypothetical protein R69919_01840 [Paraburkholderia gardini]|uniref:Uncharacterized protein n=1 Tax=Paraburkholderia gardini TaxID=2823469 RepID=A0ABN7QTV9_9BURK|nr:hypothetical protein R69919_01840 [Paraburkholderia gardini]CAG4922093.1 hypothetical protein R54767_04858 [Paraburkholderia gardini]